MLLQRLSDYADRLALPPMLYSEAPVRYIIELDGSGRLLSPQPTDTADPASPRTRRGARRLVPQVNRASGIKPLLLADNAEYTFGLPRNPAKASRVSQCHAAYRALIERCAESTREPAVAAVAAFLAANPLDQLALPAEFDAGATITFTVDDRWPIDLPAVKAFWAAEHDPGADPERPAPVLQCVVCGEERPVLERLPGKLKGVPGGQTSGTALISANAEAFESYGLHASLIAPTCAICAERFTKAANDLLASERQRFVLGSGVFLFWTRQPVEFDFRALLTAPDSDQVRELLASLRGGQTLPTIDDTAFYATLLSGSGGRAVVRDWLDTTMGEVRAHLRRWFAHQAIVGLHGELSRPLALYALAAATVRDAKKDLAPPTARALLRAALTGTPLPLTLLAQALRRNQAEQSVTRPRAALIKLVLLSQQTDAREDEMVRLDLDRPDPAYRCGRLLAILEEAQRAAIPGLNATIVDRFYGAASTTPLAVFSRLIRGAQPHLSKLERDRPGTYHALQRRLEDVLRGIPTFPRILTLEDHGLFALGYYHQRAHDRAEAHAAAERRRSSPSQEPQADTGDPSDGSSA